MWISLDWDVRWERRILNTCFYICIFFFTCFGDSLLASRSLSLFCTQVLSISCKNSFSSHESWLCFQVGRGWAVPVSMCMCWGWRRPGTHLPGKAPEQQRNTYLGNQTSHYCPECAPCLQTPCTPMFSLAFLPQLNLPPRLVEIWSRCSGWSLWGTQLKQPHSPSSMRNVCAMSQQTAQFSLLSAKENLIDLTRSWS